MASRNKEFISHFCLIHTGGGKAKVLLHVLPSFQSLSHVRLFVIPWTAARQASLSITNSWSLLKLMSIELVMWQPLSGTLYSQPREKQGNGKTTMWLFRLLPRYGIDHFHSWFIGQSTSYIQTWSQWGKNILPTGKASERCPLGNDTWKMGSKKIGKSKQ